MAKKICDYVVIGNDLSATLLATELSELSDSVLWVKTRRSLGGPTEHQPSHRSVEYVPRSRRDSLAWLNDQFLLGLDVHEESLPPVTFEEGEFKSFLGFGERNVKGDEVLRFFMPTEQLRCQLKPEEIQQHVAEKFSGDVIENAEVTELFVEEDRVQQITVNGSQVIEAAEIIYVDSLKQLLELMPDLDSRWRTKISKAKSFQRISLHYDHSEIVSENLGMHFLMANAPTGKQKKKDTTEEVCVGRFFNDEKGRQSSIWVSYIDEQEAEEVDDMGALLRFMKRQIKRAYPEALETVSRENILVSFEAEGFVDLALAKEARVPSAKNMLLAAPRTNESHDWVAEVEAARDIREQIARL